LSPIATLTPLSPIATLTPLSPIIGDNCVSVAMETIVLV
jgi:hypothetical protein